MQILGEWFGRTIIRSCTKLSYEHAQSMIESPTEKIPEKELPPISPEHTSEEVHQAVLHLHRIAKELRKQRFVDGALRLDQVSHFSFLFFFWFFGLLFFWFFGATNRFDVCSNPVCMRFSMAVLGNSFLSSPVTALNHCSPRQAGTTSRPPSKLHRHTRPTNISQGKRIMSGWVAL